MKFLPASELAEKDEGFGCLVVCFFFSKVEKNVLQNIKG